MFFFKRNRHMLLLFEDASDLPGGMRVEWQNFLTMR
jgi:hypothetical protein